MSGFAANPSGVIASLAATRHDSVIALGHRVGRGLDASSAPPEAALQDEFDAAYATMISSQPADPAGIVFMRRSSGRTARAHSADAAEAGKLFAAPPFPPIGEEDDKIRRRASGGGSSSRTGGAPARDRQGRSHSSDQLTPRPTHRDPIEAKRNVAGGAQAAVVKLASFASGRSSMAALVNYQSRNGELTLKREDGRTIQGKDQLDEMVAQWAEETGGREPSKDSLAFRLTMPETTP